MELDDNGDLLVGHKLQIPSTLFMMIGTLTGPGEHFEAVSATKLSGADLKDENGIVERIRVSKRVWGIL